MRIFEQDLFGVLFIATRGGLLFLWIFQFSTGCFAKKCKKQLENVEKRQLLQGFSAISTGFSTIPFAFVENRSLLVFCLQNRFLLQNSAVFFGKKPCFFKFFYKKYCKEEKSVIYYLTVEYTVEWRVGFSKPALPFSKS